MTLYVFSSNRALNNFYKNSKSILLPDAKTIENFIEDIAFIPNKRKLPKNLRILFLFAAIKDLDISKLGFDKTFLNFLEGSKFLFHFFDELKSSIVEIDDIDMEDTYGEYSLNLKILKQIYESYENLLSKFDFYDAKNNYEININYLKAYRNIHIFVDGILSKFDFSLIKKASFYCDIKIEFIYDKYSSPLYKNLSKNFKNNHKYIFSITENKIIKEEKLPDAFPSIFAYSFQLRINQTLLVLAKINEWLEKGITDIAIILPDENFKEYLQLFDTNKNIDYSMGFTNRELIKNIEKLKNHIAVENPKININDFCNLIKEIDKDRVLDDILLMLDSIDENILDGLDSIDLINFLLTQIPNLKDTKAGKIRIMSILESRNLAFDKLIIVDFNDKFIPMLSDNDMFLNTAIRKKVQMPTILLKENLQLHYYFNAIKNAKEVHLAYCALDSTPKIINDLNLKEEFNGDLLWRYFEPKKEKIYLDEEFKSKNKITSLGATSIKAFVNCKRSFYFKYLEELNAVSEELNQSKIHNILYSIGKDFDISKIDSLIKDNSKRKQFELMLIKEKITPFLLDQKMKIENENRKILELEEEFDFKYQGYRFRGKIDRIDRVGDGIEIIDYKLIKNMKPKVEDYLQLLIYKKALENRYFESKRALYYDVYNNKEYEMTKEIEEECEEILDLALDELKNDEINFEMTEDLKKCKYCNFKYLCNRF